MATYSSVLVWKIPGTGEPGGLPSLGSHRVGHDWSDLAVAAKLIIVVTLFSGYLFHSYSLSFGEGNGNPLQYSCLENPMDGGAWWAAVHGAAKSWTWLSDFIFTFHCIGRGNGNPLQCSCLENPSDDGAWWAAIYGVTQSRTQLKRLSSSSLSFASWTAKSKIFITWFFTEEVCWLISTPAFSTFAFKYFILHNSPLCFGYCALSLSGFIW